MTKLGFWSVLACCLALSACGERGGEEADLGAAESLLGTGKGIDHVVVAVRDLDASQNFFVDSLGFSRAPRGEIPGLENTEFWLSDTTYIELVTVTDPEQAAQIMPQLPPFLEEHEGAMYLGLDVASAERTAEYLTARGFQIMGPLGGSVILAGMDEPPPDVWHYVVFREPVVPANAIFFIEYDDSVLNWMAQEHPDLAPTHYWSHPNGALGIQAVWMAVNDLEMATAAYESLGFTRGATPDRYFFGDTVRDIKTGHGEILLMAPGDDETFVARFLQRRGEGVMGVSVRVADLAKLREVVSPPVWRKFLPYDGLHGDAVLVQPPVAHGLWIELFEQPS
ncbi:MAG: VOC family protein [Gemmatimonadota bacterium]|nr:MAG: VOC family protein [Gemmatimonadota bacterium]